MRSFRLKVDSPNGVSLRLRSILQITYNILHHGQYTNQKFCLVKLGSHVCSRRPFKLMLNISQRATKQKRRIDLIPIELNRPSCIETNRLHQRVVFTYLHFTYLHLNLHLNLLL